MQGIINPQNYSFKKSHICVCSFFSVLCVSLSSNINSQQLFFKILHDIIQNYNKKNLFQPLIHLRLLLEFLVIPLLSLSFQVFLKFHHIKIGSVSSFFTLINPQTSKVQSMSIYPIKFCCLELSQSCNFHNSQHCFLITAICC